MNFQPILPFYSANTLRDDYLLVKDSHAGLAVYVSDDRSFATIGTRGFRPLDGVSGLIIHVRLRLRDNSPGPGRIVLDRPAHNEEHTTEKPDQLIALLLESLEEVNLLPGTFSKNNIRAHCF